MYAIIVYEFDDKKYDEIQQSDVHPEVKSAQTSYAIATQGTHQITMYIKDVSLDDIIEKVQCIL